MLGIDLSIQLKEATDMAAKKQNNESAVSRYIIRDKYPDKAFSKSDKQRIATLISRQLNLSKTKT